MTHPVALVVGESITDIVVHSGAATEHAGGSPMNVAVGLSRLGVATEFHTSIGADVRGESIAAHLAASGVSVTPSSVGAAATSTARATIGADGAASYDFAVEWNPVPGHRPAPTTTLVHAGSIGALVLPGSREVVALLADSRERCTVSFDPNVRPQLMGTPADVLPIVDTILALSDVVKASDEDLHWLYPNRDPIDSALDWAQRGPAIVVVTRGADGAWATASGAVVEVPGPSVAVADTIGAGDSFMAGLLAALAEEGLLGAEHRIELATISPDRLLHVVAFAVGCAAITVTRVGANPPRRVELPS